MKFIKKDFICPFCFSKQDLYKIQFRCQNSPGKCSFENDNEYANFRGSTAIPMNKVFDIPVPVRKIDKLKSLRLPKELKCPSCNEKSTLRICPDCHSELPITIGEYQDLIISVIGAKESGKSHFIAVLIETIENQISKSFNSNLQKLDDNTIRKYNEEFFNPIYKNKEVIPETKTGRGNYNLKVPMVFSLSFMKKNIWGTPKISNIITISFFDTAGEDMNAQETMKTENKYIYNSSGIVLLVDPLQLGQVRNQLTSTGINLPSIHTGSDDIVSRVVKLIRNAQNLSADKLIEIPIAVAFSKIDALDTLDGLKSNSSCLFTKGNHDGYFDFADAKSVATEIESLMAEWSCYHLTQEVKHNFENISYFGISALGSNPQGTSKIDKIRPIRVEDPFLWLLFKNHVISDRNFMRMFYNFIHRLKLKLFKRKLVITVLLSLLLAIFGFIKVIKIAYPTVTQIISENYGNGTQMPIYYRELAGNYYGRVVMDSNLDKTVYLTIRQNPFDSTQFISYIKYDIAKTGISTPLTFDRNSMQVNTGVLGTGKVFSDSTRKITIVSDTINTLKWKIEKSQ